MALSGSLHPKLLWNSAGKSSRFFNTFALSVYLCCRGKARGAQMPKRLFASVSLIVEYILVK